jgi:hypothetical protein
LHFLLASDDALTSVPLTMQAWIHSLPPLPAWPMTLAGANAANIATPTTTAPAPVIFRMSTSLFAFRTSS